MSATDRPSDPLPPATLAETPFETLLDAFDLACVRYGQKPSTEAHFAADDARKALLASHAALEQRVAELEKERDGRRNA
jgi:hypothetical protein